MPFCQKKSDIHYSCDILRQGILQNFDISAGRWEVKLSPTGAVKAIRRKLRKKMLGLGSWEALLAKD